MFINEESGFLQDWITQIWVKATGRRFDPFKEKWLTGPLGNTRLIKDRFIYELASKEDLLVSKNDLNSGLLENMNALDFPEDEKRLLNPRISDFYEHTSNYNFEIWSEWCGIF